MKQTDIFKPAPHYSKLALFFHWGFVLLFAYGILKQVNNLDRLKEASLLRFEVHFALIFLIFLALRFFYMTRTQKTALADNSPAFQKIAAKAVHYGLYIALASITQSGLMIGALFGFGISEGLIMGAVIDLHEAAVLLSYWLIEIHVLASFYHRFRRDRVWNAMEPFWKESGWKEAGDK